MMFRGWHCDVHAFPWDGTVKYAPSRGGMSNAKIERHIRAVLYAGVTSNRRGNLGHLISLLVLLSSVRIFMSLIPAQIGNKES